MVNSTNRDSHLLLGHCIGQYTVINIVCDCPCTGCECPLSANRVLKCD